MICERKPENKARINMEVESFMQTFESPDNGRLSRISGHQDFKS